MQKLLLLHYFALFSLDLMDRYNWIPRQLTWLTDVIAVVLMVIIIFLIIQRRTININFAYWFIFALLVLHILFGVILNGVPTGAVFQGIRYYLKYIPFFLLPVVYSFSDDQIKNQIKFLAFLTVMQLPISLYQRLVEGAGSATGDIVKGSFTTSSLLSIFLICAFSMCLAFYFKKIISGKTFLFLTIALLLPTTINETKGTLFLLPFALLIPAIMTGSLSDKIKRIIGSAFLGFIFVIAFAVIYDTYMSSRYGENAVLTFFTTENRLEGYLAPQSSGLRTNLGPGRVDIVLDFFTENSDDPMKLAFGLGMSNLSKSFLGRKFSGSYLEEYGGYIYTSIAQLLWELGIIGTLLTLSLWFLIFRDAKNTLSDPGYTGAIALGILGVLGVLTIGIFYKNILHSSIISTVFWYFAGYIAMKGHEAKWQRKVYRTRNI